jgi:hypothetical protein
MQSFDPSFHYAWFFEGSQLKVALGAFGMVALVLAGVMFPLWPSPLRIGVWYLSIGVLGLVGVFFGLAIFRLIFYVITLLVAKPGIWIFPKLFDDVGIVRACFLHHPGPLVNSHCCTDRIFYSSLGMGPAQDEEEEEKDWRRERRGREEQVQKGCCSSCSRSGDWAEC